MNKGSSAQPLMPMLTQTSIQFRAARSSEDFLIAEHFYRMWRDIGISEKDIQPNWQGTTQEFIQQARQTLGYQAFVAEVEGAVVGSASCQLYAGLYPQILTEQHRKYGYIWGVYVEPTYRKQGIATRLTQLSVDYLTSLGCTRALLNAAPEARSIYQSLEFVEGNTMWLDF